ncbi:MAG: hypothetical protein RL685_6355, partial [Pseudomonadota bacterium]
MSPRRDPHTDELWLLTGELRRWLE